MYKYVLTREDLLLSTYAMPNSRLCRIVCLPLWLLSIAAVRSFASLLPLLQLRFFVPLQPQLSFSIMLYQT